MKMKCFHYPQNFTLIIAYILLKFGDNPYKELNQINFYQELYSFSQMLVSGLALTNKIIV